MLEDLRNALKDATLSTDQSAKVANVLEAFDILVNANDDTSAAILQMLFESVLIDFITNRIQQDPAFAAAMLWRMQRLADAMKEGAN